MVDENESKTTWSIINESGKVKYNNHTPTMFRSGKTSFELDSAADAFNDNFLNVVEKLILKKETLPLCPVITFFLFKVFLM
jgi:hypothetical protein